MKFKEITYQEMTDFYLSDPELILQALSDEEITELHEFKRYPESTSFYLGVEKDNKLICIIQWEMFAHYSVIFHVRLKTELQRTGVAGDIFLLVKEFFTKLKKTNLISYTPEGCIAASKCLLKLGFKEECVIPNTVMWRNEKRGLVMYSYSLENRGDTCQQ